MNSNTQTHIKSITSSTKLCWIRMYWINHMILDHRIMISSWSLEHNQIGLIWWAFPWSFQFHQDLTVVLWSVDGLSTSTAFIKPKDISVCFSDPGYGSTSWFFMINIWSVHRSSRIHRSWVSRFTDDHGLTWQLWMYLPSMALMDVAAPSLSADEDHDQFCTCAWLACDV